MKKTNLFFFLLCFFISFSSMGQDTLPNFSLVNAGNNRIIIGWTNTFSDIRQISIQRSFDSTKNYKTILTVPDPTTLQNGYVDAKADNDHMYYRLYIMREKGVFLFSNAKKPVIDTTKKLSANTLQKPDTIQMGDSFIVVRPSEMNTANFPGTDPSAVPVIGEPKPKVIPFTPSNYVFTNQDGYVRINLPESDKIKKYAIKFFEDDGTFLFELKEIFEKDFKIDKSSFYHAGWFRFELYEDGKILEKHKFYLRKDF